MHINIWREDGSKMEPNSFSVVSSGRIRRKWTNWNANTGGSVWTEEISFSLWKWNKHWNGLPKEAVEFHFLEIFKAHLDMVLDNQLLHVSAWAGELEKMTSRGLFPPQPFYDSVNFRRLGGRGRQQKTVLPLHLILKWIFSAQVQEVKLSSVSRRSRKSKCFQYPPIISINWRLWMQTL